jgi:hypothetical protein
MEAPGKSEAQGEPSHPVTSISPSSPLLLHLLDPILGCAAAEGRTPIGPRHLPACPSPSSSIGSDSRGGAVAEGVQPSAPL